MQDVKFFVITRDNANKIFDELKKNGVDEVLIGVTDEGYEVLAINFAKVRNHIVLQNEIIKKYKAYYEGSKDESSRTTGDKAK